jgi:hypothetical protein
MILSDLSSFLLNIMMGSCLSIMICSSTRCLRKIMMGGSPSSFTHLHWSERKIDRWNNLKCFSCGVRHSPSIVRRWKCPWTLGSMSMPITLVTRMVPQNLQVYTHACRVSLLSMWWVYKSPWFEDKERNLWTFHELISSLNSWSILIHKICSAKCLNYEWCLPTLATIIDLSW